ncbi:MAG TPA: hypothetical protein DCZ91_12470 [Lachnospiraceae bacterium]|nr:hypothetical protein [Lachnospiraceae bacterium]
MEMMEIILLIAGGVIFVLSFFIPDRKGVSDGLGRFAEDEVRKLVRRELESQRVHVDEVVEESVSDAIEKAERTLERLCNEKIMAVNEYSDTVLNEIHKNHEEAVFLYDMLNNKHTSLKNTVAEVNSSVKEAEEMVRSLQQQTPEAPVQGSVSAEEVAAWEPSETVFPEASERGKMIPADRSPEEWPEERGQDYNNNDKILRLYKKGKSAVMIAKELELGIGEVRLVIDLFRNQS